MTFYIIRLGETLWSKWRHGCWYRKDRLEYLGQESSLRAAFSVRPGSPAERAQPELPGSRSAPMIPRRSALERLIMNAIKDAGSHAKARDITLHWEDRNIYADWTLGLYVSVSVSFWFRVPFFQVCVKSVFASVLLSYDYVFCLVFSRALNGLFQFSVQQSSLRLLPHTHTS